MAERNQFGSAADIIGAIVKGMQRGGRGATGAGTTRGSRGISGLNIPKINLPRVGRGRGAARPPAGAVNPDRRPAAPRRDPRRREEPTATARIHVAYEPRSDGDADPGEIVWAWVPYEDDPRQGKDRPLVVIGHVADDVAALQLTSRPHADRHHHALGSGSWDRRGRPSWVKLDRLLRLDPDGIRREGAVLDQQRFGAVIDAFRAY